MVKKLMFRLLPVQILLDSYLIGQAIGLVPFFLSAQLASFLFIGHTSHQG